MDEAKELITELEVYRQMYEIEYKRLQGAYVDLDMSVWNTLKDPANKKAFEGKTMKEEEIVQREHLVEIIRKKHEELLKKQQDEQKN